MTNIVISCVYKMIILLDMNENLILYALESKGEYNKIIDIIKEYNYKGALIVELSSAKGLSQSLEFIKKFL